MQSEENEITTQCPYMPNIYMEFMLPDFATIYLIALVSVFSYFIIVTTSVDCMKVNSQNLILILLKLIFFQNI